MSISHLRALFELQLEASELDRAIYDVGTVLTIGDGIARVAGLHDCMAGELLEFADGTLGIALNLEYNAVGVVLFTSSIDASLFGGVDGGGSVPEMPDMRCLESPASDIMSRVSVHEPFATGITAIDAMIPIGRGQRELIIGDRQTGKSTIAEFQPTLGTEMGCFQGITSTVHGSITSIQAVYVPADDMTDPAPATTTVLSRALAAKAIYPAVDVLDSTSTRLQQAEGQQFGGSMTSLPIVETQEGDVSAYIPTNVISIADGQVMSGADGPSTLQPITSTVHGSITSIQAVYVPADDMTDPAPATTTVLSREFFSSALFNAGFRPAINIGISVSRGWIRHSETVSPGAEAPRAPEATAGQLKLQLAQFAEVCITVEVSGLKEYILKATAESQQSFLADGQMNEPPGARM